jgi:hypothetical protein
MAFGRRRGYSDCITGVRARNLLSADEFAEVIGRPLNVSININWSKTSAGDDTHGRLLRDFRKAAGRFLRECGGRGLTCTWARERPTHPIARPNAHMNCHVPTSLWVDFSNNVLNFLPSGCVALEKDAIWFELIGFTREDRRRRTEYLVKGAHAKARLNIKRKRIPQGRVHAKRCGTSEDIGRAARLRWNEMQQNLDGDTVLASQEA